MTRPIIGLDYAAIINQIATVTADTFAYVAFSVTPNHINWFASNPVYPAAFVSPAGKSTEGNDARSAGTLRQSVTESFTVLVLFENDGDMLAQEAANQVPLYREQLRLAIVNWRPLPVSRTVQPIIEGDDALHVYEGGARTGWLFSYSVSYQIDSTDCYQPVATPDAVIRIAQLTNQVAGEG